MACSSGFDDLLGKPFPGIHTGGPGENLRIDLLARLARYLPQYYLCYACLRLHLWRHIDLPTPNFKLGFFRLYCGQTLFSTYANSYLPVPHLLTS